MNVCILMGSPRKEGNTAALLKPFCEELSKSGAAVEGCMIWICGPALPAGRVRRTGAFLAAPKKMTDRCSLTALWPLT